MCTKMLTQKKDFKKNDNKKEEQKIEEVNHLINDLSYSKLKISADYYFRKEQYERNSKL